MAMAIEPMVSIKGELMDWMRTLRRLARNRRRAAFLKRSISHNLGVEGLHDAVAGDCLVQNVLNFGELVLAGAGAGAD